MKRENKQARQKNSAADVNNPSQIPENLARGQTRKPEEKKWLGKPITYWQEHCKRLLPDRVEFARKMIGFRCVDISKSKGRARRAEILRLRKESKELSANQRIIDSGYSEALVGAYADCFHEEIMHGGYRRDFDEFEKSRLAVLPPVLMREWFRFREKTMIGWLKSKRSVRLSAKKGGVR